VAIVRVEIFERSPEVREAIIRGITEVMVANGAKAEGTEVIIYEIAPTHWARGGETFERRLARAEANGSAPDAAVDAATAPGGGGERQPAGG